MGKRQMIPLYRTRLWDRLTGVIPYEHVDFSVDQSTANGKALELAERYCMDGEPVKVFYHENGDVLFIGDGDTGVIVERIDKQD